jgi:hypothetical protein
VAAGLLDSIASCGFKPLLKGFETASKKAERGRTGNPPGTPTDRHQEQCRAGLITTQRTCLTAHHTSLIARSTTRRSC